MLRSILTIGQFFRVVPWSSPSRLRECACQGSYFESSLIFWQHLAAGLPRSQAFIVTIFFRNIASLIEVAASLAANNHGNSAFADRDFGVNLIGLDQIDLPRAD